MPDHEFLPGERAETGAEELLDSGYRRVLWPRMIAGGVTLLGAVTLLLTLNRGDWSPDPSGSSGPVSRATPSVVSAGPGRVGRPLLAGRGGSVIAVAASLGKVWLLESRSIHATSAGGATVDGVVPGAALAGTGSRGQARLIPDGPASVVWMVVTGARNGRLVEYDANTLHVIRHLESTPPLSGAAALDGELFVTNAGRLLALGSGGGFHTITTVPGFLGQLLTDAARHRIVMVQEGFGKPYGLRTITTDGPRPKVSSPVEVTVGLPTVAVAGDAIWVAGLNIRQGTFVRLGLDTLRPIPRRANGSALKGTVTLVGSGRQVIWLRDESEHELRCVDANTGRQLQSWQIDGPVASTTNLAVVATQSGAIPLLLSDCPG